MTNTSSTKSKNPDTGHVHNLDAEDVVIRKAIAAHEAAFHAPVVVLPPPGGIPAMPPATAKTRLHHNFATDGMGVFVGQDYPNVHEVDHDEMLGWKDHTQPALGRYLTQKYATDAAHISIHDGFLDLLADRQTDGTYLAALVASFAKNDGTKRNFECQYGTLTWAAQILGVGAASWHTPVWELDAWRSPEIDPGEVIGGRITVNLHGSTANGQHYSGPAPVGWAIYTLTRTPTDVSGTIAGVPWGPVAVAMPAPMPILLDAKYGLAAPDATTPAALRSQIAWIVEEAA